MGEKPGAKRPLSLIPAPVPIEEQYKQQPPMQQPSWWSRCIGWLQYHTIQLRWDIERWLARRLHRRWGG